MSFISVDFISLSNQTERLKQLREEISEKAEEIHSVIKLLAYMELYEVEDELFIIMRRLLDAADEIDIEIFKIGRITELYNNCENEIEKAVNSLPLNMPDNQASEMLSVGIEHAVKHHIPQIENLLINSFGSHSIINDDWLSELIMNGGK